MRVVGSEFGGDNGVAAAPDGSVIYINRWSDGTLRIVPLKKRASAATIKLGNFHPDNVHWRTDGNLLIAGQVGAVRDIMGCMSQSNCPVGSIIVVVDPARQSVLSRQIVAPTPTFAAAATALQYGKYYWLSSFRGDRLTRVSNDANAVADGYFDAVPDVVGGTTGPGWFLYLSASSTRLASASASRAIASMLSSTLTSSLGSGALGMCLHMPSASQYPCPEPRWLHHRRGARPARLGISLQRR